MLGKFVSIYVAYQLKQDAIYKGHSAFQKIVRNVYPLIHHKIIKTLTKPIQDNIKFSEKH